MPTDSISSQPYWKHHTLSNILSFCHKTISNGKRLPKMLASPTKPKREAAEPSGGKKNPNKKRGRKRQITKRGHYL
jgi:hypothetical protein